MIRHYKSSNCPKHVLPSTHAALISAGLKLHSFYRHGHEAGCFNYVGEFASLQVTASVGPTFHSSSRLTIFIAEEPKRDGSREGRQIAHLPMTEAANLNFRACADAWLALRPYHAAKQACMGEAEIAAYNALL